MNFIDIDLCNAQKTACYNRIDIFMYQNCAFFEPKTVTLHHKYT